MILVVMTVYMMFSTLQCPGVRWVSMSPISEYHGDYHVPGRRSRCVMKDFGDAKKILGMEIYRDKSLRKL